MSEIETALAAMKARTIPTVKESTVFGVRLADLTDEQCRVAMLWFASALMASQDRNR